MGSPMTLPAWQGGKLRWVACVRDHPSSSRRILDLFVSTGHRFGFLSCLAVFGGNPDLGNEIFDPGAIQINQIHIDAGGPITQSIPSVAPHSRVGFGSLLVAFGTACLQFCRPLTFFCDS